jgi:hypothetical protein
MRKWLLTLLLISHVWAEPAGQLLDEVLAKPGFWTQVCDARVLPSPRTIAGKPRKIPTYVPPLPLFGYQRWGESKISAANFLRLRARRSEIIREIARRLQAGVEPPQEFWMILLDLNGIEALPALLKFEKQFTVVELPQGLDVRDSAHIQVLSVISGLLKNEGMAGLELLEPVYTQAQRDAIVGLASKFLNSTPLESYRAAAAMSPRPTYR